MTEKTTASREALLKAATFVRPALSSQNYIPALTHIKFVEGYATSYNDISAISVRCELDIERCLPGELLIRALGSFGAESVMLQEGKDGVLVLSSGRSKLKLPTLDVSAFPFKWPGEDEGAEVAIDRSILKGIERCLLSVGNDPTHPAAMGVTLDFDDAGKAVLFSTDNATISRYQTKSKIKLPGDAPVILPRFFCEQLVILSKAFPEEDMTLILHDGALQVDFGKAARLFSKTPVDLEPLDFPRIIDKNAKLSSLEEVLFEIPGAFDAAFGRALLVLSAEVDKATKVTVDEDHIRLSSTSPMGEADDSMAYEANGPSGYEPFYIDPALVVRASKSCARMAFAPRVMILADAEGDYLHFIAHSSK